MRATGTVTCKDQKLSSGRHRLRSRQSGGRSLHPASGGPRPCQRQVAAPGAQHRAWEGAVTRTPCEAGTRRARKTRWRQNRALRLRGGNFSNRAALGVRSAGQAPRVSLAYPPRPAVEGRTRQPPAPLAPSNLEAGVRHQRERRAVFPRTSRLPWAPGRPATMCSPPCSPPVLSAGCTELSPITSHLGLRGISRRPRRAGRRWQRLPRLR
ncbi:uncharacterized protein LOC131577195 [Poecile atricapillus]|uniref:uncharacterized protein LOC131577195 n=1 Tax=Poecile atricapillus TaxID=48891 RepID=UPI00273A05F1|nr:uncharacterized protein LOC131577195 [Poecile atricapillus]XP_058690694.1 uncharacterized protein LOC131577195 [Poecile atricapillus]